MTRLLGYSESTIDEILFLSQKKRYLAFFVILSYSSNRINIIALSKEMRATVLTLLE